jgi:hypothetical protein
MMDRQIREIVASLSAESAEARTHGWRRNGQNSCDILKIKGKGEGEYSSVKAKRGSDGD